VTLNEQDEPHVWDCGNSRKQENIATRSMLADAKKCVHVPNLASNPPKPGPSINPDDIDSP